MEASIVEILTSPGVMANGGLLFLFLLVVVTVIAKNAGKIQVSFGDSSRRPEPPRGETLEIAGALVSDQSAKEIITAHEVNTQEMRRLRESLDRCTDEISRCARATENSTDSVNRVHSSLHALALEIGRSR